MSDIIDLAFYGGLGLIGYAHGSVLGAGLMLSGAALLTAILASDGETPSDAAATSTSKCEGCGEVVSARGEDAPE